MPKYLIRDTSNGNLSTVEGTLPLDLSPLLGSGTYGVSALSNEVIVSINSAALLEDGSVILLESGDKLLLEAV